MIYENFKKLIQLRRTCKEWNNLIPAACKDEVCGFYKKWKFRRDKQDPLYEDLVPCKSYDYFKFKFRDDTYLVPNDNDIERFKSEVFIKQKIFVDGIYWSLFTKWDNKPSSYCLYEEVVELKKIKYLLSPARVIFEDIDELKKKSKDYKR
ncbi:8156_t:CDS:2 [Dentiscutata erythropus]|uniref:8156_t:CDS:1 n=1 Tax=Dentiscutata erythropus TaxID=1348616 RepID=A0A9N9CF44_9GLOM|nr:8156_t:CDS:2 [Dentiscutata erythropus]